MKKKRVEEKREREGERDERGEKRDSKTREALLNSFLHETLIVNY